MSDTTTQLPPATVPTTSAAVERRLTVAVAVAGLLAAVGCVAIVLIARRPDWWPGFVAATVVSAIGGAGSVAVLSRAAGKTLDWLVTIVMGAVAVRMLISLFGLLVATMAFHTPPEPTGFMICGYYAAMLIAETTLLSRVTQNAGSAAGTASAVGGSNA